MGVASLIAQISLALTTTLVASGQVARTLPVTGASVSTPIEITSPGHGVPPGRVTHAVISGVLGTVEANGTWSLTVTDGDTFALSTYTAAGVPVQSVGVNAYTGGGQIQVAFPDGAILFTRFELDSNSAVASPRIVVIPTDGRAWTLETYGGAGGMPLGPQDSPTTEQVTEALQPPIGTEWATFEVHVTGAANPPSPNFGDIDATRLIAGAFWGALYDYVGDARCRVLHTSWPSQKADAGVKSQRGQKQVLWVEIALPILPLIPALQFVPAGTSLVLTVEPENPLVPEDQTIIEVT